MTAESLVVVVPCFNEERTIGRTVQSINEVMPRIPIGTRVIMIDDGSTDATLRVMEELCETYPFCETVANSENLGVGRSVLNVFDRIPDGSWVTVIPGDNEFVFDSIRGFLQIRERYDVILGYIQNPVIRTWTRRNASYLFTKVASILYGFPYRYLNGMKLYRIEAFRGLSIVSGGHAFNAELIAKALLRKPELRIGEAPFAARGRALGQSKAFRPSSVLRAVRDVVGGYRSVARYRKAVIKERE